ncbi:hypothetical protein MASR2M18_12980 [Ignavibacteria bacterium]|nr:hypothetical protein [Bacteroidota bacterium]MCZ2132390.1 hypothetical protein [Bacteroidota bacterium]
MFARKASSYFRFIMHETTDIFLCRGFSGQIFRLSVNPHQTVEQLTAVLAPAVGLYAVEYERLGLYNLTRDIEYKTDEIIAERGLSNGDLLILADGGSCHKK